MSSSESGPGAANAVSSSPKATAAVTVYPSLDNNNNNAANSTRVGNSTNAEHSKMNWEPVRSRLTSDDLEDALKAARELRAGIEIVHTVEFPLMLSALLPAFSTILATSNHLPQQSLPQMTLIPTEKTKPAPGGTIGLSSASSGPVGQPSLVGKAEATIASKAGQAPSQLGSQILSAQTQQQQQPMSRSGMDYQQQQQHYHYRHYQLRNTILEIISKMPTNEVLRPHAPHLVAVALDVLIHRKDYEENALLASRIIFDLYKAYRSLPQDYIQQALDFVVSAYKTLPTSVQRSFSFQTLSAASSMLELSRKSERDASTTTPVKSASSNLESAATSKPKETGSATAMDIDDSNSLASPTPAKQPSTPLAMGPLGTPPSATTPTRKPSSFQQISLSPRSNASFRVLTEWPLIVMLMFQLYPKFLKGNISILIKAMTEALGLRAPSIDSIEQQHRRMQGIQQQQQSPSQNGPPTRLSEMAKRLYLSKCRELVASQAKTLSFLTFLLRGFVNELKPYEDRLATNVLAIMSTCPRELVSTRKELLVATRHLLHSDHFQNGFFKHVDSFLDERILIGRSSSTKLQQQPNSTITSFHFYHHFNHTEQTVLRPLGYAVLSELVHNARQTNTSSTQQQSQHQQTHRSLLTLRQISRIITIFSRVLHDPSLPMTTQYTALKTLLSILDAIYSNKDKNPQIGRDLLVRIFRTFLEKLSTLQQQLQETSVVVSDPTTTKLSTVSTNNNSNEKDIKSMVRIIVVGSKTLIWYINNYRLQREKEKVENIPAPRVAGIHNEEVYSGMSKITNAEKTMIDEYIILGMDCIKVLKRKTPTRYEEVERNGTSVSPSNAAPISGSEKAANEQFRDTLTYFAAAFTTLDGHDLRRILGKHLNVLVDAIKEDPTVIIVPRHLLNANSTTSFEFCSMMLNFLLEHMDDLAKASTPNVCFLSAIELSSEGNRRLQALEELRAKKEGRNEEDMLKTSNAHLQLFERILKSLSSYPENERALRPHLKKIVSICLRSTLEKTQQKADNYCMLLRYVFRSISAGKFEESYKELLPLIPMVLNGLFRVLTSTQDSPLRHTLIELVLTIPARLSSLLPHMNLLLRVIILALKSNSDDLVNLGLRTLEFWIDNLNPEFLFPELSKQKVVFVALMKSLSIHLRPAPYPYGLLTLRLLGKLGGKNRKVLREPMEFIEPERLSEQSGKETLSVGFAWSALCTKASEDSSNRRTEATSSSSTFHISLPIHRCMELLKRIANANFFDGQTQSCSTSEEKTSTDMISNLWDVEILLDSDIENIDFDAYCKNVTSTTAMSQVKAAIQVLRSALTKIIDVQEVNLLNVSCDGAKEEVTAMNETKENPFDMQTISTKLTEYNEEFYAILMGLMFGCSFELIKDDELCFVKGLLTSIYLIVRSNQGSIVRVDANGSSLLPPTSSGTEKSDNYIEFGEQGLGSLKPFGYFELNGPLKYTTNPFTINRAIVDFLAQPSPSMISLGIDLLAHVLKLPTAFKNSKGEEKSMDDEMDRGSMIFMENLLSLFCRRCLSTDWDKRRGLYQGIDLMVKTLGKSWARTYEVEIMNVALFSIKNVPSEMSIAGIRSFEFLIQICTTLYGKPEVKTDKASASPFVIDLLSLYRKVEDSKSTFKSSSISKPCSKVLQILINEMASTDHLMRTAARFVFEHYFLNASSEADAKISLQKHITLIRRVLFSRSLRLLPLREQVGAVEALAVLVDQVPDLVPLDDQHLLAFLSELLKMSSVADGEMTDSNLIGSVVDKNGFVLPSPEQRYQASNNEKKEVDPSLRPSSLFLRRDCILSVDSMKILIGEELPFGIQLRVSSIQLLRSIIRGHPDKFFDAESSTPVGNIRPHIISLLFRSLVSHPIQAVTAAHNALRDVLTLSVVTTDGPEGSRSKSRLRKELLQTCIRPVLLNLRDYTRLSTCLLRGLSQLLSLLSSWFNKTLGEKLLDHLQKWTDPNRIISHKIWKEGEEPQVAAAIVGLFALLPHASNFVDPLVKTTIKLEACLPAYKSRNICSPYRKPLALYLNKYSQYTVAFFLQRLKTPLYTELFQDIIGFEGSSQLRQYLSTKCSDSILNVSFKSPLAIIRSEKASIAGASPSKTMKSENSLSIHGIQPFIRSQSPKETALLRDLAAKEKRVQILQQEYFKAKEYLRTRVAVASGTSPPLDVKLSVEDAKKKHKIAKSSLDRGVREIEDVRKRHAAEVERSRVSLEPNSKDTDGVRPMTIDSLELQYQGFCLIKTLVRCDSDYLKEHNDVFRALRWLWRSRGRYLRMQHEEWIPPRFHGESKALASFLVSYARNSPDDIDLLFELIRIFLQPSSRDFYFVRSFLKETCSGKLEKAQKEQIMQRFFALMTGESTEEIKTLSLQLVVFPMLNASFHTNEIDERNQPITPGKVKTDICLETNSSEHLSFLNSSIVQKFISDILLYDGKLDPFGDRLKVGLLQIVDLFLKFIPSEFKERGDDVFRFCWSLLRSDDTSCKNWAYLVLCRYVCAIKTPQAIVLQLYDALLRAYQHEPKDLVRTGINLLMHELPKMLDREGFKSAIDKTYRVMFEEGNSVPQLAHVWYIVVNHPELFVQRRLQLVRHMINSLNRLALLPNSPAENRVLAISIVELIVVWENEWKVENDKACDKMDIDVPIIAEKATHPESGLSLNSEDAVLNLDKSMVDTMANFLVRLKILLADPKVDTNAVKLEPKLNVLFRKVVSRWKGCEIRPTYLEKVVSMCKEDNQNFTQGNTVKGKKKANKDAERINLKGPKSSPSQKEEESKRTIVGLSGNLRTCLEILQIVTEEDPSNPLLSDNPAQLKSILGSCFRHFKEPSEIHLREKLQTFLVSFLSLGARADERIVLPISVWIEKLLVETDMEYRKNRVNLNESPRQARNRQSSSSDDVCPEDCAVLFSLDVVRKVGHAVPTFPTIFTSSMITLLSTIVEKHTLQAATKQKQNGVAYNSQTGSVSVREMYATPISGILQQIFPENIGTTSPGVSRSGQGGSSDIMKELKDFDNMAQSAVVILDIVGNSDVAYLFSNSRKKFLSLLQSILDMSNSVHLLMSVVNIIGKWLIAGNLGPLTLKERVNFILQISSFDFNGVSDIVSQPLADLVCYYMSSLLNGSIPQMENKDIVTSRSLTACLLMANDFSREKMLSLFQGSKCGGRQSEPADILWQLLHNDFEALGGRHWVVVFVEIFLQNVIPSCEPRSVAPESGYRVKRRIPSLHTEGKAPQIEINSTVKSSFEKFASVLIAEHSSIEESAGHLLQSLRRLSHGDSIICQKLMQTLFPASWASISDDQVKLGLVSAVETFLSQPFHSQAFRKEVSHGLPPSNAIKSLLSSLIHLDPLPFVDVDLMVMFAQSYNSWYEVLSILENQYLVLSSTDLSEVGSNRSDKILLAMRHCYRQLGEEKVWTTLALKSCAVSGTSFATSLEIYGKVDKALEVYSGLIEMVDSEDSKDASCFELDYWEERWVNLQQEGQQLDVVSEYGRQSQNEKVMLECAWRERDWDRVRSLCSSPPIVAAVESGDPAMKICETLSAVADGKLGDVENLHAQSSQLALYKWQNLPAFSGGSCAHAELMHYFHRLVEIRESGQIMVETNNHSNGKTLPDLKNLLNAWRHRLPNDEEDLTVWDEIFTWRAHMFNAITSNFHWSEPSTLATLHDRPWTAIRMSMVARKHGMQQTAFLLLNRITDSRAMDVSDVYLKLREQILLYNNPSSELERTGGLNLINTTNLSYFDSVQKSELFRLKAIFLASLRRTSKSNQAYCHSVQICPSHTKSWISWGGLCSSLGSMTEKQAEQARGSSTDKARDSRTDSTKKVAQYLAQAMGCFIEAIQIDPDEKSRIHLPRCLWMLTKDGSAPGVLCQTLENRGAKLPPWVWLPWIPQLLTGLCRLEGRTIKVLLTRVIRSYPQAAYYSLRAFYLERRDVERAKGGSVATGQHMASVAYAEEMMSTLRRSHASLWSSLEAILEELIVKFRPSYEEELLATISALLERAESHAEKQSLPDKKRVEDEEAMVASWSKTLSRIAAKFFRETDVSSSSNRRDERVKKTADFKRKYKADFELDFKVTTSDEKQNEPGGSSKAQFRLVEYITKLQVWKERLEMQVARTPNFLPLIESSHSLAMYHGCFPNLWPGSCDTRYSYGNDRSPIDESQNSRTPPSTSSSAAIARKAALGAAIAAAGAAAREGIGGEYGGGSAAIEIPGQYCPNSLVSTDTKPCAELHAKLVRFEPYVEVLRRNDQLVRRCGMVGSDGRTYKFLLQFAIPYWTRTDERAAQTSYVMDKFLRRNMVSARNHIQVQPTAAIPVAQRLRMTPDPSCRLALDEVWRKYREEKKGVQSASAFFSRELTKRLKEKVSDDASDESKSAAEKEVRFKVYNEICESMIDDRILLRYLLKVLDGPETFFLFRRSFSVQLAANSLLQYVFSVTERTPQRFVILQSNGKVLSPDFRISYSNQGFIEGFNQVPFRMTPNIQKVIGEHYLHGVFVRSMAMIAGAVKEHQDEFDPILRLLMRDDILAWYSKSLAKTDSKTQELERQLIERVSKNVYTLQTRFSECSPKEVRNAQGKSETTPLDKRVTDLLETATNAENLCMTRISYQGWL